MRSHNSITTLLTLTTLFAAVFSRYTYSQLSENLYFAPNTPQVRMVANMGTQKATAQYSIYGWYKFNGETPAISNIVSLRNIQYVEASTQKPIFAKNPQFPDCPVTQDQLKQNPELCNQPGIVDNPNCFPVNVSKVDNGLTNTKKMAEDLLYINFDLNPKQGTKQDFSIIFLVQSGIANTGNSDMKIEGFTDLPCVKNMWSFFAISADYVGGQISIYFNMFLDSGSSPKFKTFSVNYPEFALKANAEIVIAGVELNPYFQSTSGFIGNIASVEMGLFYTTDLEAIWSVYLSKASYASYGVVLELLFDIYPGSKNMRSSGMLQLDYGVDGSFSAVNAVDRMRVGMVCDTSTSMNLGMVDFNNSQDLVRAFVFYFHLKYNESMPSELVLLTRGSKDRSGYIRVVLIKKGGSRVVQIDVKDNTQNISWQSSTACDAGKDFYFLVGIAISPANSLRVVYWDNTGASNYNQLAANFMFDVSPQNITLLNNKADTASKGSLYFYRFMIVNSASSVLYNSIIVNNINPSITVMRDKCELYTSSYEEAFGCFSCRNAIANRSNQCVNYCPYGFINAFTNTCVKCNSDDCNGFDTTKWTVERRDKNVFRLRPNRKIVSDLDFDNLFIIKVSGTDEMVKYTKVVNKENQFIDITLDLTKDINNKTLDFILVTDPNNPQCDVNHNIIYQKKADIPIDRICIVLPNKRRALRALAIVILAVYCLSFLMLVVFTICCFGKITDVGGLWKFFLHNWMRLQMVAFFLLLAVNLPCCVKEFLNILYLIVVRWDHAFGTVIDHSQKSSASFNRGLQSQMPPERFAEVGVRAFILHNLCVAFIVHLVILLVYIVVKIWDWLITSSSRFMYKMFVFMEFTVLIVGYLLVEMHIFVFSALNYKLAIFTTGYFVICFLIAIAYILVFVVFWVVALVRLAGAQAYFMNPVNYNRFYYFFAGYRDSKWARTYDLWLLLGYLVIGLMIGLLLTSALAQMIVILVALVVLFLLTLLLRPWVSIFLLIVELLSQALIIAGVVVLLIIAAYDNSKCYDCGNREGSLCWLIVMFFFLGLLFAALGLILGLLLACCLGDRFLGIGHRKKVIVVEENEFVDVHNEHHHVHHNDNYFTTSRFDSNNRAIYNNDAYYGNVGTHTDVIKTNINNNILAGAYATTKYESIVNDRNVAIGHSDEFAHRSYSRDNIGGANMESKVSEQSRLQENNKKTMHDFLKEIKRNRIVEEDRDSSYYTGSNSYVSDRADREAFRGRGRSTYYGDSYGNTQVVRPDDADEEFTQPQIIRALSDNMEGSEFEHNDRQVHNTQRLVNIRKEHFYNRSHDDMYNESGRFNRDSNHFADGDRGMNSSYKNDSWYEEGDSVPLKTKSRHYGQESYFRSRKY